MCTVQDSGTRVRNSVCPECGCRELVRDPETGELVCRGCGVVVSETELDRGPDWRAFTLDEKRELPRAGSPLSLMSYDRGLSTTFNPREMGGGLEQKAAMWRLKKWDHRYRMKGSRERNLARALTMMRSMGDWLGLPGSVMETAARTYRRALKEDLIRGRTIRVVVAVCLYMACRECHVARSLDEVAREARTSVKDLARIYRLLFWKLDADVPNANSKTRGLISRIVVGLGIPGEVERLAALILREAEEIRLTGGKHPAGIAASCVYISSRVTDNRVIQEDLSDAAGVTEVTLRNRYKDLLEKLDIAIPL